MSKNVDSLSFSMLLKPGNISQAQVSLWDLLLETSTWEAIRQSDTQDKSVNVNTCRLFKIRHWTGEAQP